MSLPLRRRTAMLMLLAMMPAAAVAMPDPGVPDLAKAMQEEKKEIDSFKKDFGKNKAYPPAATFSPRGQLLAIAEKPENQTLMARSLVNQTWYRLFGHGLVMRIDQMQASNPEGFEISIQEPLAISNDPKWVSQIGAALVPDLLKLPDLPQQIDATVTAAGSPSVIVPATSPGWKYIAASGLTGDAWLKPEFDDAAWKSAQAPVGRGSPLLADKKGDTLDIEKGDVALRLAFEIDGTQWFNATRMILQVASSESATVSLNGKTLDDDKKGHPAEYWNRTVDVPGDMLVPGRNTVAVRLKNAAGDAFFDMQLAILDEQQARERARQSATATAALPTVPKAHEVRGQAIASMVWALAAGSEFRFNH